MKTFCFINVTIAAMLLSGGVAAGGITWLDTEIEVKAGLGDETAKAEFRFENRGETTIKITDVRRTCGCTVVELDKKEYAPGESGNIEVSLRLGEMVGTIEKSVVVKTDGGSDDNPDEQRLKIKAVIPKPVDVAPGQLDWTIGRRIKAKKVIVTATEGMSIQPVEVKCRHSSIEADFEVIEEGKTVQLAVFPTDTDGSLLSEVALTMDVTSGKTTVKKEIRIPVKVDYDW